jgi:hypothetical protein
VFAGGFIIGIIVMNMGKTFLLAEGGVLNIHSLNRMKYLEVDGTALLRFVLSERAAIIALLVVLATTFAGIAASYLFTFGQGALIGMFITAATIRYGLKGILLIIVGLFPHQLLLIPAWVMLLNWCCQLCCKFYFPAKDCELDYANRRRYLLKKGVWLLWIIGVVIIGSILECYVNPILVTEILNIF